MKKSTLKHTLFTVSALFYFSQTPSIASETSSNLNNIFIVECKTNFDYGLHSYYLFLHQPVFQAQSKALKQTEVLLRQINNNKQQNPNTPISSQQSLYIPVSFEPQSWVTHPKEDDFEAAARWIMQNYDYQCAKMLLEPFPQLTDKGPYILSSIQKLLPPNLTTATPWRNPVLTQNLSNIEPVQSLHWLDMFFKESSQPRQWAEMDLLHIRKDMLESLFPTEKSTTEENALQANQTREKDSQNGNPQNEPLQNDTPQNNIPQGDTPQGDTPKSTRLISAEDVPPSFIALEKPEETVVIKNQLPNKPIQQVILQFNPAQNYPVNETQSAPRNPYIDLITIEFSRDNPIETQESSN